MTTYRVEIDGKTVWEGDGEGVSAIPAEYLDRPANAPAGDQHPSPHYLYEDDELIGIQVSLDHETDLEDHDHPATWVALAPKEG